MIFFFPPSKYHKPISSVKEWLSSAETRSSPANQAELPVEIKSNAICSRWLYMKNNRSGLQSDKDPVQLPIQAKPFLAFTQKQRFQKNYSTELRSGECKSQHNSLHMASHVWLFLVNERLWLYIHFSKRNPKPGHSQIQHDIKKKSRRGKWEKVICVTLEIKYCVFTVINKASCSDLMAHFIHLILAELCSRIKVLAGKRELLHK